MVIISYDDDYFSSLNVISLFLSLIILNSGSAWVWFPGNSKKDFASLLHFSEMTSKKEEEEEG